jgi:hypothetical protein
VRSLLRRLVSRLRSWFEREWDGPWDVWEVWCAKCQKRSVHVFPSCCGRIQCSCGNWHDVPTLRVWQKPEATADADRHSPAAR